MKALTLTQPWASLVAIGAKRIETRGWSTNYRGPIAIHAAKAFPGTAKALAQNETAFRRALGWPHPERITQEWLDDIAARLRSMPTGCVIAVSEILDCRRTEDIVTPELVATDEYAFGDYAPGRYGFILGKVMQISPPVPVMGSLGLWNWEEIHA